MKNKLLLSLSAFAIAMFVFSGCAKVPQVEIDNANVAIQAAQTAGADIYVPQAFAALKDSMNATTASIEAKKSKLFKSYKKEKAQLISIVQLGNDVKLKTEARINELKTEIQTTLTEVTASVAESKQLITQAPRGKEGTTALMAIKADLATIETTVGDVQKAVGTESYIATLDKAKAVKEQAASINTELKSVIEKYKSKKAPAKAAAKPAAKPAAKAAAPAAKPAAKVKK
jgi:predicted transport protein